MAAGASQGDDDGPIAAINVTPMVDLTLVLLIIFMVAAPLLASASSIKVNLPKAATAETTALSPLTLTLARRPPGDAQLYANGQPADEPKVRRLVAELLAKDRELQAIISADEGVDYGRVMRLVDLVKSLGVGKFALSTESRR
jgi:biopolymer transport protein ExbD